MAKPLVKIGRKTIGGLADFYAKDVPGIFAAVKDDGSQKDFKAANDAAIQAVRAFDSWLAQDDRGSRYSFGPTGGHRKARLTAKSGRTPGAM
jgi:hypothetical protein